MITGAGDDVSYRKAYAGDRRVGVQVLSLSAASRLRNASFRCVLPETAGDKPETFVTRCGDVGVLSVVAKVTTSAIVKLARQTDDSASSRVTAGSALAKKSWENQKGLVRQKML